MKNQANNNGYKQSFYMKHFITLWFTFFLCGNIFSQKISIRQQNESIGNGNNMAIVATIFEADISDIEKEWKSLMKSCDAKVTMGGEIFADNARLKGFDNTCDVYARIKNISDKEKELMVAVDLGGAYLSGSHPALLSKIENMMYDFALKMTKDAIAIQIKDAEKAHRKMVKEQENLADEKEQLLKDIENYKNKITQAENAIIENDKMQEVKKAEIEKHKTLVEDIKNKFNSFK